MKIRQIMATVLFSLSLTACSVMQTTPESPPPAKAQAQEITRAQAASLTKMKGITVTVIGSPMDAEREIESQANDNHARYYQIISNTDSVIPGRWYAYAILYR